MVRRQTANLLFVSSILTGASIAASSCTADKESDAAIRITPESRTVSLQPSPAGPTLNTAVTIRNRSLQPILWSACDLALERYQYVLALDHARPEWVENWRPVCFSSGNTPPARLRSGESVTVPISIVAARKVSPKFTAEPGSYRIRFFLSAEIGGEFVQLPAALSASEPFTLVSR